MNKSNTSITYYEVGCRECYECDTILKQFRNKVLAEAYYNQLEARKQEFIKELMNYPLGENKECIYENHAYKWGDKFDDIDSSLASAMIDYVRAVQRQEDEKTILRELNYVDYYCEERTIEFDD